MITNNHRKFILLILLLPILGACNKKESLIQTPIRVKTFKLENSQSGSRLYYSGTIEAEKNINLSFLTIGTVSEVLVREGQPVQKGELLAKLDCQNNENALRMAEAKSKQANDAFRRFEPMYKNDNLPEIKMVEIETGRTEAALAFKMAAKNAADCSIIAPENGIISDRSVEPGSSAIPGKAALRLVTVDHVYAAISVPEGEISRIKPGMRAEVEILALQKNHYTNSGENHGTQLSVSPARLNARGGKFKGLVADSGVSANPLARTYNVRVFLNNPDRKILPGMICNVYISEPGLSKLILVPSTAVSMDEAGQQYVYMVEPGGKTAHKRIVQTAGFAKGGIVVSRGLAEGETVVAVGVQKLTDGAHIAKE
jgi:membrane fusion protein, multidrug efflux system